MPQSSSIDRLPADVSASLEAWLSNPDVTQGEATRRTNALLEKLDLGELRLSAMRSQPCIYRPVRRTDYIGPSATRDPGPYRIRATAGFVRGVL